MPADRITPSELQEIPIRENQALLDSRSVRALRGMRDYADEQPKHIGQDRYTLEGSALSQSLSDKYDQFFARYMASKPGSEEARNLLSWLSILPTC